MKKSTKIVLIVLLILVVLIAIIGTLIGIGIKSLTKEKNSITASEFRTFMESKGFAISDATSQFSNYSYIDQVYVAVDKNRTYQIEFYTLENEDYAVSFYENNKHIFESSAGNSSLKTNVSISNHSKYTLSSNGTYKVISRIGNTVIYLNVNDQYKDEVQNILNELDY